MLRTTAILNLKGGVAKTTTAINMAALLARNHGARVLLVDADSQCNLTEFFGADPERGNLADLLRSQAGELSLELALEAIQETDIPGVHILPGDQSLMDMDLSAVKAGSANTGILRELAKNVAREYDYMLIDCPPAFNAASAAALVAADDVVIPIKLDAFSLRGMGNLMHQIATMRQINPRLRLAGFLPTMWYRSQMLQDAEDQLKAAELPVFPHIRRSNMVDSMTWAQDPLLQSSPHCGAAVDYKRFVRAYAQGVKSNG